MSADRFGNAIENTWKFRDNLKARLRDRLQEEHEHSEKIKQEAREKVKNFCAIPLYLRDGKLRNNRLLINGKADLAETLIVKQDKSIEDGLKRLRSRKPVMNLTLTKDDLKELGLKEDNGKIVGEVKGKALAEKYVL